MPGNGPYRVIVVDPPWPYEVRKDDPSHRATHPYPQMSIAQIRRSRWLDRPRRLYAVALDNQPSHARGLRRLDAWGFRAQDDLDLGQRSSSAPATGCAARPSTASWRCAARRSFSSPINRLRCSARCAKIRRSRRNSTPSSKASARRRATPNCFRGALGRTGMDTAMSIRAMADRVALYFEIAALAGALPAPCRADWRGCRPTELVRRPRLSFRRSCMFASP